MEQYPFIVKSKLVKVAGTSFVNALDRVLARHPNRFIKTKFAKRMDLISAQQAAAKESKAAKKPIYVIIDNDGEADISAAPLRGVAHKFINGVEDKNFQPHESDKQTKPAKTIPAQSEKAAALITKKESSTTKKKVMKTNAKKSAVKKSSTPVKSVTKPVGKLVAMTVKAILSAVKAGSKAFNEAGKPLPEGYLAKMKDQTRELKATIVK